jgi:DNA invertase Pin-like site-specific DNA recombinase
VRGSRAFLSDIQAQGCDLYLHQQAIDTSTPSGRMLFQMLGVFAEFERAIITSRIIAGQARARSKGVKFGRPPLPPIRLDKVQKGLLEGRSIRAIAATTGVSTATVQRVKRSMQAVAV